MQGSSLARPLIPEWGIVVEGELAFGLLVVVLVIGGIAEWRKRHIGRPAIAVNAALLWQVFYDGWASLPSAMQWYLNIGTAVGLLALASYLIKKRLPTGFYRLAGLAYGSLTILVIIIALVSPWTPLF